VTGHTRAVVTPHIIRGTHLGTIRGPEHTHNLAWGDADGRTLYLTAQTGLYRIRLNIPGTHP
jgi:gluconolactonase